MTDQERTTRTTVDDEAERAIGATLSRYRQTFDEARFDEFAALSERGRWSMVPEPGAGPVRDWIDQHAVLDDGRPLARHEVSEVVVRAGSDGRTTFACHIAITQELPGGNERCLARARFTGTFRHEDDRWWWCDHAMRAEQTGDLSTHLRGVSP